MRSWTWVSPKSQTMRQIQWNYTLLPARHCLGHWKHVKYYMVSQSDRERERGRELLLDVCTCLLSLCGHNSWNTTHNTRSPRTGGHFTTHKHAHNPHTQANTWLWPAHRREPFVCALALVCHVKWLCRPAANCWLWPFRMYRRPWSCVRYCMVTPTDYIAPR